MHFVTGGAFNGKLQWVKNFYSFLDEDGQIYRFYQENCKNLKFTQQKTIIISGLEFFLKQYLQIENGREKFQQDLSQWLEWEKQKKERKLTLIGSDMSKGVVPINKEERLYRDFVSWCYQDVVKLADRVDIIWYGINETIKCNEMK